MSAQIVPLPTKLVTELAWREYSFLCITLSDNPKLSEDEEFMKRMAKASDEFQGCFKRMVTES
jgi:hypothetical protein